MICYAKASFDFCETEARKHAVPMPDGQLLPPAPPQQSAGDAPQEEREQQPAQGQPVPQVGAQAALEQPADAQPAAKKQSTPKLPILMSGEFKATLVEQPDPTRKHYATAVPWAAELKPGATCCFTQVSDGIPKLGFTVPNVKHTEERSIKIAFSMPSAFLADEVRLSGLQVQKYAKLPKQKQKAREQPADAAPKKQKPAPQQNPPPPPPPPHPDYEPAAGFELLAKPTAVPIGSFIAHRFDTASWERGWCEGIIEKQCDGKRHAGQFEVKYEGFNPAYYFHKLDLSEYGIDKTWVAVKEL